MKGKFKTILKSIFIMCFFVAKRMVFVEGGDEFIKIQEFKVASSVIGKQGMEAEMAYYTQLFSFVDPINEYGSTMLRFIEIYGKMSRDRKVTQYLHWKKPASLANPDYANRDLHCRRYLSMSILEGNDIEFFPKIELIDEIEMLVDLDYYSLPSKKATCLRCPVEVRGGLRYLYFIKIRSDSDLSDSSYFVLAGRRDTAFSTVKILMYSNYRPKFRTTSSFKLDTIVEESDENQTDEEEGSGQKGVEDAGPSEESGPSASPPQMVESFEIDFEKILLVPNAEANREDRFVVFGMHAERALVTASHYHFVHQNVQPWFIDKFISLMNKLGTGRRVNRVTKLNVGGNTLEEKIKFCGHYVEHNPALRLRKIRMDFNERRTNEIRKVLKPVYFPRTRLPATNFKMAMVSCPVLHSDEQIPELIYLGLIFHTDWSPSEYVFTLLNSGRKPRTVFPVSLCIASATYRHLPVNERNALPPFEEDPNAKEDTEAGPSVSAIRTS